MASRCQVCGRPFHEGQGISLVLAQKKLDFHSKACAYKFLKELVSSVDEQCLSSAVKDIQQRYEDALEKLEKVRAKKI